MADVSVLNVSGGSYDSVTTSSIVASAETGQIPCENGKDNRRAVLVINGDDEAIEFIVNAPASGGGVRSSLGNLAVSIAAGDQALIPLFDTARFKVLSDNDIDYTITDSGGTDLGTVVLSNVTIVAMQL